MAAARIGELGYSRRNIEAAGETREGEWSRRTFPLIVAVHSAVIGGAALLGETKVRWPWLALLFAAQPLRAWVLLTLGRRWNVRAAVPSRMHVATEGPYAYIRHPNYLVVAVELAALPLAFGLGWLAFAATAVNSVVLAGRIREEEAALEALPGYVEHFGGRKRFIPHLF